MGYGSYRGSDWAKLKHSSKISDSSTSSQIFSARSMEERFNPYYITMRESRDNEDHPNSTPVIIGLDTTGSMGYLSAEIAKNGLNETMLKIYSTKPIEDPQIMFAAIGDVVDRAPLQVTQFESDIRIAEQLLALWLEGSGADAPEDFELLWYFAAKHTSVDSFEKHKKKGFLFTIGDADVHAELSENDVKAIFNDDCNKTLKSVDLAKEASKKYELFHIHLSAKEPVNMAEAIPGRIIYLPKENVSAIPEVIISAMELVNGVSLEKSVAQWSDLVQPVVREALKKVNVATSKKRIIF